MEATIAATLPASRTVAPIPIDSERRHQWRATAPPTAEPGSGVPPWRIAVHAVATFVVVFAGGLLLAATTPRLFGYDAVVVSSGSMSPAIRSGDVVVTTPVDDIVLAPGTVINFERNGETVLHRIVSMTADGFTTAGDSNAAADSVVVTADDVRGVGVVRVPFAGWPTLWLERGAWGRLAVFIALSVGALHLSRTEWLMSARDPEEHESDDTAPDEDETSGSLTRLRPYVTDLTPPPIPPEARIPDRIENDEIRAALPA